MTHRNDNNNVVYAEADSQEETVEQLMADLDTENGPWSPLFPTDAENGAYDPWIPQFDQPDYEEVLAGIPYETIGRYLGRSARRNLAERDIEHQGYVNIQADFVEEVSQRLEVERRANFSQRQVAILERQNDEGRRRIVDLEEQEERQRDTISIIESIHQQEIVQREEKITMLEGQVYQWMTAALEFQDRDNRQLEYLNNAENRYWADTKQLEDKIRELEWTLESRSSLSNWAKSRTRRAKRNGVAKSLI